MILVCAGTGNGTPPVNNIGRLCILELISICRFYVNTREQPPRPSWEHPLGPMPQAFAPPLGPPPDRSYNRSPYGASPQQGYPGYPPSYGMPPQGYYNTPQGGYAGPPPQRAYSPGNRGMLVKLLDIHCM